MYNHDGETALHTAIYCQRHDILSAILSTDNQDIGINFFTKDRSRLTALQISCQQRDVLAMKLLLQHGADANVSSKYTPSPLFTAAELGDESILKVLLKHGAHPLQPDAFGKTPLLVAISQTGNVEIVRQLLAAYKTDRLAKHTINECVDRRRESDNLKCQDKSAQPKLQGEHLAEDGTTKSSSAVVIKPNIRVTLGSLEPLCTAISFGRCKIVDLLLDDKWYVKEDLIDPFNNPLLCAADSQCLSCMQSLLNAGADINVADSKEIYALYNAMLCDGFVHFDHWKRQLKKKGAMNETHRAKLTALQICCHQRDNLAVELLLQNGADANVSSKYTPSPLFTAAELDNESMVKVLLKHGAHPLQPDAFDKTPLLVAISKTGSVEIVRQLLAAYKASWSNAERLINNTTYECVDERTGLGDAKCQQKSEQTKLQSEHLAEDGTANLSSAVVTKPTIHVTLGSLKPLCFAIIYGRCEIVNLLLNEKWYVKEDLSNPVNNPLLCAADSQCLICLQALLNAGADINVTDSKGFGALHYAVLCDRLTCFDAGRRQTKEKKAMYNIFLYLIDNNINVEQMFNTDWYCNIYNISVGDSDYNVGQLLVQACGQTSTNAYILRDMFRFCIRNSHWEMVDLLCCAGFTPCENELMVLQNMNITVMSKSEKMLRMYITNCLSKNDDHNIDLPQECLFFTNEPRTLQNCAVVTVRKAISRNVFYNCKHLPIPRRLKDAIMLKDIM